MQGVKSEKELKQTDYEKIIFDLCRFGDVLAAGNADKISELKQFHKDPPCYDKYTIPYILRYGNIPKVIFYIFPLRV